ncbi:MAG: glycosyl transferase family 1 [Bacteroidetes bacterium]|nr:glycosyl transferase family 1 [Bacteroidota bacterium]
MKKIYFLARLFNRNFGGGLIRSKQIELLRESGFQVIIVTPNYLSKEVILESDLISYPINFNLRIENIKQRIGIIDDYLDKWVKDSLEYLKNVVKSSDIIFASASGELGPLKLATLLKKETGCKYVANLHDPLNYSQIDNLKFGEYWHVSREKNESKYLSSADLIITSSVEYRNALVRKYPSLKSRLINIYFGYTNIAPKIKKNKSGKLRIVYGGVFQKTQGPEILLKAASNLPNIQLYFIGDHRNYKFKYTSNQDVIFIDALNQSDYHRFLLENIDIGFVSLSKEYYKYCVPSKIFEYINLNLPILGALPNGDAVSIILKNKIGLVSNYTDIDLLRKNIIRFQEEDNFSKFIQTIESIKPNWNFTTLFNELLTIIKSI